MGKHLQVGIKRSNAASKGNNTIFLLYRTTSFPISGLGTHLFQKLRFSKVALPFAKQSFASYCVPNPEIGNEANSRYAVAGSTSDRSVRSD